MICSNCGKREVEVLIKHVVGQEVNDICLCRVCAQQMGFLSPDMPSITISFSVNEHEAPKIKNRKNTARQRHEEQENALVCPSCGLKYAIFRDSGLLGCPACYEAFRFPLGAHLQETQGAESHWGGMSGMFDDIGVRSSQSSGSSANEKIAKIQSELDAAIECEDYETAAILRDMLKRCAMEDGHDI